MAPNPSKVLDNPFAVNKTSANKIARHTPSANPSAISSYRAMNNFNEEYAN